MPEITNKIKIRYEVISILSKYQNKCLDVPAKTIEKDFKALKEIEDNSLVVKILLDEINSENKEYSNMCALFLLYCAQQENLEKRALEILNSKKINAEKKFLVISILKQKGVGIALDDLDKFIESSNGLFDEQISDFLTEAFDNPDVQIDLLDFYNAITDNERLAFLKSMEEELQGDKLAILLSLIAHVRLNKNETNIVANLLTSSKSLYSTYGLEYILKKNIREKVLDFKLIKKTEQEIKKNKLKNKDFKDLTTIKNSKTDRCLISLVDGKSTFSLMYSRINKDNTRLCVLLTISLTKGITSVIGFSSLKMEAYLKIIKRVFSSSLCTDINPSVLKAIIEFYYNKNFKTDTAIPYEFCVWKKLLNDVEDIKCDISEFLNSKLETTKMTDSKVRKMINLKFFENWFYLYKENENIDKIINFIEAQKKFEIVKTEAFIRQILKEQFVENPEYIKKIHSDLLIQSYVSRLSKFHATSRSIFSLCFYPQHLNTFINSIVDRSIYQHYIGILEDLELENSKNIFLKTKETSLAKKEIKKITKYFEEKWK